MSQELLPPLTLDELTEETARQILVTLALGATSDPLSAITYLLERYLEETQELLAQYQLAEEERASRTRPSASWPRRRGVATIRSSRGCTSRRWPPCGRCRPTNIDLEHR